MNALSGRVERWRGDLGMAAVPPPWHVAAHGCSLSAGAARFGRRTARPHARPAAPPHPHEDGRHEAAMANQAGDGGRGDTAGDDACFTGALPEGTDPPAIGVPYVRALRCFAPAELWQALRQARGGARPPEPAGRNSEPGPHQSNEYADEVWSDTRLSNERQSREWAERKRTEQANDVAGAADMAAQLWCHEMPKAVFARLGAGELRAFGRKGSPHHALEWLPPEVWNSVAPPGHGERRDGRVAMMISGERWWHVHVHDTGPGLPLALAALAYGSDEQAHDAMEAEWQPPAAHKREPANNALRRELLARLAASRAVVTSGQGGRRTPVPAEVWAGAMPNWEASSVGDFRDVRVRLRLAGAVDDVDGDETVATERVASEDAGFSQIVGALQPGDLEIVSVANERAPTKAEPIKSKRATTEIDDSLHLIEMHRLIEIGEASGPDRAAHLLIKRGIVPVSSSVVSTVARLTRKFKKTYPSVTDSS